MCFWKITLATMQVFSAQWNWSWAWIHSIAIVHMGGDERIYLGRREQKKQMWQLSVSEETRERIDWIRLAGSYDKDLVLKLAGSWTCVGEKWEQKVCREQKEHV